MKRVLACAVLCLSIPLLGGAAQGTEPAPAEAAPDAAAPQPDVPPRLDDFPEDMLPQLDAYVAREKARLRWVGLRNLGWPNNVVTVAFHGGNDELYALIEAAAKEWTDNPSRLKFQFRDGSNRFRTWSPQDTVADDMIRISFDQPGYWSAIGITARARRASEPTMNFEGFATKLEPYYGGKNHDAWLASYVHGTVVHEFGHAVGLAHEHFHPDCQADLRFEPDPGYQPSGPMRLLRGKWVRQYLPDTQGRQPGVLLALSGYPNGWSRAKAEYNMKWETYLTRLTAESGIDDLGVDLSGRIDQASVMLYQMEPGETVSGASSKCRLTPNTGNRASANDIRIFQDIYQ